MDNQEKIKIHKTVPRQCLLRQAFCSIPLFFALDDAFPSPGFRSGAPKEKGADLAHTAPCDASKAACDQRMGAG